MSSEYLVPQRNDNQPSLDFMVEDLARSGLTPEDLDCYPIRDAHCPQAYLIKYPQEGMFRSKFNRAVNKYSGPKGRNELWYTKPPHADKSKPLYIIEGEKKAASFQKVMPDARVVGIGGCWNGCPKHGDTNELLPELKALVQPGTQVIIVLDGDIMHKTSIQNAGATYLKLFGNIQCMASLFMPPLGFKGLDDYLVTTSDFKLTDLVPFNSDRAEAGTIAYYKAIGCKTLPTNSGKIFYNELNASIILNKYFDGTLYQDRRLGLVLNGETVVDEEVARQAVTYMQGIDGAWKKQHIVGGLMLLATETRDTVRETFLKLKWDGVKRLDTYGHECFKTDGYDKWADEWLRTLITGMTFRIINPGTKVDPVWIIAGVQGLRKTTFFEQLSMVGNHSYYATYTDDTEGDRNQTLGQTFASSILVDLAEGAIFETSKKSQDKLKQTVTQLFDKYRVAFAKSVTTMLRGFVFVGTTNRTDFLSDVTGSRRYRVIEPTSFTLIPPKIRDQLVAEVIANMNEILDTNWYDMHVGVEDMPKDLREMYPHITDAVELNNQQYEREDSIKEYILTVLNSREKLLASVKKKPGVYFISAPLLELSSPDTFKRLGVGADVVVAC